MASNLNKLKLEKNNFIRNLSQEQFDGVITNKYKKVFMEYFDGTITESELAKKVESNLDLINIYENGEDGKIDPNQYLYSAIVDVALDYFNVANGFETCINKMNLFASYFQLVASVNVLMEYLDDLIFDVFFIKEHYDGTASDEFLNKKLDQVKSISNRLNELFGEISKHEDVVNDVEKSNKNDFCDDSLLDETIKEMYVHFKSLSKATKDRFKEHVDLCIDESIGVKLDILKGKLY